jgi:hypothetical protein
VKLLSPDNVSFQQIRNYSAIVVYDAGELTPRLREFLQACSSSRKGVLYLADANLSASWKAWLSQNFGLQIMQFNPEASPVSYLNPYNSITSIIDSRQLAKTSVADYWTSQNAGSANILLAADNSPLAAASENSLLWLFDVSSLKSRFFLDSAFPVFAFRSLQYLANSQFESEQQTVGQLLTADEITLPDGDKTELNGSSFKTYEPGIYTLSWRGSSPQNVAIGIDYKESDYKPLDIPKSGNYHLLGAKWQEQLFLSRLGHDIWKYLLLAVVVLFILELVLVKSEEWKTGSIKS